MYIEICAGPEKKSFSVHKAVLTTRASHFADVLRGGTYREAQENKFEFPDVESDVMAAFVSWLYKETLVDEIPENRVDSFDVTIRLYEFADSINLVDLQNKCLDHVVKIVARTTDTPHWGDIAAHYENSVPGDMMRKLLVDLTACVLVSRWKGNVKGPVKGGRLNEELVLDVLSRINKEGTLRGPGFTPLKAKYYHVQKSLSEGQGVQAAG